MLATIALAAGYFLEHVVGLLGHGVLTWDVKFLVRLPRLPRLRKRNSVP